MQKKGSSGIAAYITLAVLLAVTFAVWIRYVTPDEGVVEYSEILAYFDEYDITHYTLDLGTGELVLTVKGQEEELEYTVPNVSKFLEDTKEYRKEYNERNPESPLGLDYYKIKDNSWLLTLGSAGIMVAFLVVLIVLMMKQTGGGGGKYTSFGKAAFKNSRSEGRKTTFADVAGANEEKKELEELVDFLKTPKKYEEIGARIPKGVLLSGPPGTGKTLLARAVAGESGCPFFSISGSDFVEMFVGVGASRVRDLFEHAKKNSPSIIFIDEIDAVGRHRGAGLGGGHDEREQTLNQLLVEMDGFAEKASVIVIAATNRADILDPALLRPGRFDRQIHVGRPDIKGREEILRVHSRKRPLAPDVSLSVIAKATVGFTGADLENLINEASLLAARAGKKAVTKDEIEEATVKVMMGPEKKSRIITEEEKKLTAYHEAGHAICTYYCSKYDKVHQVSIIPRGRAEGFTLSLPHDDMHCVSKNEMKVKIVTLLGGRVAEKIVLDDITTGASNDIERATTFARDMVMRYGFSDRLGPIVYGNESGEVFLGRDFNSSRNYSENVAAEIDAEIREIIEESYETARETLEKHDKELHTLAEYLLEHEKIDGEDFVKLMEEPAVNEENSDSSEQ